MVDDDHGARALALQAELATSKADAASIRAALEQEEHIAACALATCERLRKERDAARLERAATEGVCESIRQQRDEARWECEALMETTISPTAHREAIAALRAEVERWQQRVRAILPYSDGRHHEVREAREAITVLNRAALDGGSDAE